VNDWAFAMAIGEGDQVIVRSSNDTEGMRENEFNHRRRVTTTMALLMGQLISIAFRWD
jgi:hypothetical protein